MIHMHKVHIKHIAKYEKYAIAMICYSWQPKWSLTLNYMGNQCHSEELHINLKINSGKWHWKFV